MKIQESKDYTQKLVNMKNKINYVKNKKQPE